MRHLRFHNLNNGRTVYVGEADPQRLEARCEELVRHGFFTKRWIGDCWLYELTEKAALFVIAEAPCDDAIDPTKLKVV